MTREGAIDVGQLANRKDGFGLRALCLLVILPCPLHFTTVVHGVAAWLVHFIVELTRAIALVGTSGQRVRSGRPRLHDVIAERGLVAP
jgi:hypothetical protein